MADQSWKITALAPRDVIEAALLAHEEMFDWDPDIVLVGSELADDRPEEWRLEAYLPRKPRKADMAAVAALFQPHVPPVVVEQLPDADWVTESQQHIEPVRAGCFHVRTPDHPHCIDPALQEFVIPASQAFGTGHHATTSGCLAMLCHMKARGLVVRNLADVGTGTGLLAFAALHLWPRALATASDIDPVCVNVVESNARANGIPLGAARGALTMTVAAGIDSPLIEARGPYDLVMANILAGPLIELAPDFATSLSPGGSLLLSGLLASQESRVRASYRRQGLRLAARMTCGDWSVLWLRKRRSRDC
ncbi:MAG: 50S ribosomal protein L11 methyltransferase [Novosphingobium sp.]